MYSLVCSKALMSYLFQKSNFVSINGHKLADHIIILQTFYGFPWITDMNNFLPFGSLKQLYKRLQVLL